MSMKHRMAWTLGALSAAGCGGGTPPASSPAGAVETAPDGTAPLAASAPAKAPPRADSTLLARQLIFGNPDRAAPRVSPDGKRLAWLAPKDGVLNVFVAPVGDITQAKVVKGSQPFEIIVAANGDPWYTMLSANKVATLQLR